MGRKKKPLDKRVKTHKGIATVLRNELSGLRNKDVQFVCIGTDKSTGDSLAPFVGTMLENNGYKNVIGTVDNPLHNMNKEERFKEIKKNKTIIAIDACFSKEDKVGSISIQQTSIVMGQGVRKIEDREANSVGDYAIKGCVCRNYGVAQYNLKAIACVRLSEVLKMAEQIVRGIMSAFPLK